MLPPLLHLVLALGTCELENVAIANALQLESARATPAFSHFNYDAMPSLMLLNPSIAIL